MDTSALSNPLENMPEDIYVSLWDNVAEVLRSGCIAVTTEIYQEMWSIPGKIGTCISECEDKMKLEVGEFGWDWKSYISHMKRMKQDHYQFISEYNGGSKRTVGLNDLSIIALAKTLGVPVISMEHLILEQTAKKRKFPISARGRQSIICPLMISFVQKE